MSSYNIDFKILVNEEWINIDNYVIDCDAIPFIDRNRDYEITIPEFNIKISETISEIGYVIDKGTDIIIYVYENTSRIIFTGTIETIKRDYEQKLYNWFVKSHINELTKHYCDYDTLHSDLINNSQDINDYCLASNDNENLPNVRALYLIERMFQIAGLTIFDYEINDNIIITNQYDNKEEYIPITKLALDEWAIYAINQAYVVAYGGASTYDQDGASKYTFFDFVSLFCSLTGLFLVTHAHKKFRFESRLNGKHTLVNNYLWQYYREEFNPVEDGYNIKLYFGSQLGTGYRNNYTQFQQAYSPVLQRRIDDGPFTIDFPTNLFFLVRRMRVVNITNINTSGGLTRVYVDDITTYTGVVANGRYIKIEGVEGMTEINGIHRIYTTDAANKIIFLSFTPTNAYTTGGTVDHAATVYPNHYWDITNTTITDDGIQNKTRTVLNNYVEERLETLLSNDEEDVIKNHLNIVTLRSEMMQESYE